MNAKSKALNLACNITLILCIVLYFIYGYSWLLIPYLFVVLAAVIIFFVPTKQILKSYQDEGLRTTLTFTDIIYYAISPCIVGYLLFTNITPFLLLIFISQLVILSLELHFTYLLRQTKRN